MKKGSKLEKCKCCGKGIFWRVPTGNLLGMQMVDFQKIADYKHSSKQKGYFCKECYEKHIDIM